VTAGLRPELFAWSGERSISRTLLIAALTLLVLSGFGLRARGLGAEGLSEDEFNKLSAVGDYRAHGLTAANGEHPLLMKALETASIIIAEKWNQTSLATSHPAACRVSVEAALRLPSTIFGALTVVVLYLVAAELFGGEIALITAALWAIDPTAISFNRIAKEDTFLLFFFLLANVFWLRSQRVAESESGNPLPYYWATAASFGAMLASKYMPHLLAISVSYYHIFQGVKESRWRLGKRRFLIFIAVMCTAFVLCNLTILLPGTWRQMLTFASYKRLGHDSYEFMGRLYSHKLMDWFKGVPWYFYFVFMAVKLPLPTLAAFLLGLPQTFRRKLGDGRFFLLFWTIIGFLPFVFVGGKFTRYLTPFWPVVLITAAIGVQFAGRAIGRWWTTLKGLRQASRYMPAALAALVLLSSLWVSLSVAPYYRLYTNLLGGGARRAGDYFPQDEFYDAYMRGLMSEIARRARAGARVASETPTLAAYYAERAGRPDLNCVSLSDPAALREFAEGDFLIIARGRTYFSNSALVSALHQSNAPAFRVSLGSVPAAEVYALDQSRLPLISSMMGRPEGSR
jgi:predicted membrane-bound dolichyl-phosphate-mannose-protein mannosyltransferase